MKKSQSKQKVETPKQSNKLKENSKIDFASKTENQNNFLQLFSLAPDTRISTRINAVIYSSCRRSRDSLQSEEQDLTNKSLGISGFNLFKMSAGNTANDESVLINESELTEQDDSFNDSTISKENVSKDRTYQANIPGILRHKCKDNCKTTPTNSPIKVLAFSPSRFLNNTSNDTRDDLPVDSTERKYLTFLDSSFDVEDSGIGVSDGDVTSPLSPPSLTSTPCMKSRRKSIQKNLSCPLLDVENTFKDLSLPYQSTPKGNDAKNDVIKTPLIRKYLNESAPRTPTPVKCFKDFDASSDANSHTSYCNDNELLSPEQHCFKRPSPVVWKSRRWKHSAEKSRQRKTARKALQLEDEPQFKRNLFKFHEIADRGVSSVTSSMLHSTTCDQSSLIGNKTVVERNISHGRSVYCTRRRKSSDVVPAIDNRWVSVACGCSLDQKVMTEAAKRCLRQPLNSSRYSS